MNCPMCDINKNIHNDPYFIMELEDAVAEYERINALEYLRADRAEGVAVGCKIFLFQGHRRQYDCRAKLAKGGVKYVINYASI